MLVVGNIAYYFFWRSAENNNFHFSLKFLLTQDDMVLKFQSDTPRTVLIRSPSNFTMTSATMVKYRLLLFGNRPSLRKM